MSHCSTPPDEEPMQLSSEEQNLDVETTDSSSHPAALAVDDAQDSSAVRMLDWSERTSSGIENLPLETSADSTSASSLRSVQPGSVGGQSESGYSERHSKMTTGPSVGESPEPGPSSHLPPIKIGTESGKTKYVAVEVDTGDRGPLKIIRAAPFPFPDQSSAMQESYVSGRVCMELGEIEGVSHEVIGFGSVEHDVERRTIALHEEGTPVFHEDDTYLSEQTRLFVDLVRGGGLGEGYRVYYVDGEGQRSKLYVCPKRKRDQDGGDSPPSKKRKPTD